MAQRVRALTAARLLLGVTPTASRKQLLVSDPQRRAPTPQDAHSAQSSPRVWIVQEAYQRQALRWHPDRHTSSPPAVRRSAAPRFRAASDAFSMLLEADQSSQRQGGKRWVFDKQRQRWAWRRGTDEATAGEAQLPPATGSGGGEADPPAP